MSALAFPGERPMMRGSGESGRVAPHMPGHDPREHRSIVPDLAAG